MDACTAEPQKCGHCGGVIADPSPVVEASYPANYYVRMLRECEWAVHVDCYPEWQVGMLEQEFKIAAEQNDLDESQLDTLRWEAQRLERAVRAHQKLLAMVKKCEAAVYGR